MSVRLLALVTLLPAVAFAQTWNDSFTQSQLDALLGGGSVRVLVAGAGEPAEEVARAAEALRVRLRESGLASLVMDAAALGSLKEDSDDSVRKKAATLPWDRLLIVRVFPGARDSAPTAVITVSEPAGATRRSLVVTRGQPIVPAPVAEPTPPPLPVVVAEAPPPAPAPPLTAAAPPRHPRELHFGQAIATKNRVGLVEKGVFLGAKRISGLELYQLLDRPDFIKRSDARVNLKRALGIAGGAVGAAGVVGIVASLTSPCVRRQGTATGRCLQKAFPDLTLPSAILGGLGVGLIITAFVLPSEPVPAEELLPDIDAYNAKLEKKPAVSWRLEPSIGFDSTGLVLSGTF